MAYYLVRAWPRQERLGELHTRLVSGEIRQMQPFGRALEHSLQHARRDRDGSAVWEEEDYCSPPLAQERAAVLDAYFDDLQVQPIAAGAGWAAIAQLPSLWQSAGESDPA
ncbi:hypothetical protein [Kallotenue papyrolyticum]|uniref:hypothetical protein n=1 Tax=Kallotenue papyrolyticum TaxID=1325125 RepID=UPI0004785E68|nr:hypothetical protein [Kallotenue papyrolyticum]